MATIKDIARLAGVSQGTASNVLNGKGNVSSGKILQVQEAARKLGYAINENAKLLRKGQSKTIAVIVPNSTDIQFIDFVTSFSNQAKAMGYEAVVAYAQDMHCYGYWFRNLGFSFSGDAADVPDAILAKFLQGEIPTLFEDTTTSPSTAHGALDRMEKRIPPEVRHRYYAMHLPDRHVAGLLREKGFSVASCKECEMELA